MSLDIRVENVHGDSIPNLARFANYIGIVAQINGSLIDQVIIDGHARRGPETTSPDGRVLTLGQHSLPPMTAAKPSAVAAWCGVSLHGFAHSRYSPRTDEPLRATLQQRKLHRTWNMIEDARIERLLLREFPGWQPHLMGAVNHLLLSPQPNDWKPNLSSVYPLIVGRTYLPAALRQESYEAFAAEHSEFIADAVKELVLRYLTIMDPGSEDHDETVEIVTRLHGLLGDYGTECGSHDVEEEAGERQWTDPGDPSEDEDDESGDGDVDPDADPDEDGNHTVTDDGDGDGDESDDDESGDGEPCDGDGEEDGDETGDGADGSEPGDESDGDESDGDGDGDGDGEGESDGSGSGADADGDPEGSDDSENVGDVGDGDDDEGHGKGSVGEGSSTSRLADWTSAIDSALASDERLNDISEAVTTGPMPLVRLDQRNVKLEEVPVEVQEAELDVARELRVLMDGARPGMRRRVDRGRFNVARVVREGGTTRPEEMFDRHDPGALRSTGCAVAVLADVSGSMKPDQLRGAMSSVWSIDRAVRSVRGSFKAWTFGTESHELPESQADGVWVPTRTDGSTNPIVGLGSAYAWLSQQREPNKLCIVATDGAWNGSLMCEEVLLQMVQSGIQVAVFGIGIDVHDRFSRVGVSTFKVDHAGQIGPAIGGMLVNKVRRSLHR